MHIVFPFVIDKKKRKVSRPFRWITFLRSLVIEPRFYVSTSKSIIKALINMHSFEIQLSPIG
ncbi:hypothetical protein EWR12_22575 [Escherichia coli]|nr:hypothetical protein [Escherichia coli]EFN7114731.1 hypothetical protein [Escherichia coli]